MKSTANPPSPSPRCRARARVLALAVLAGLPLALTGCKGRAGGVPPGGALLSGAARTGGGLLSSATRTGGGVLSGATRGIGGLFSGGAGRPGGGLFAGRSGGRGLFSGGASPGGSGGLGLAGRSRGGGLPGADVLGGKSLPGSGSRAGIGSMLDSAAQRHGIPPNILKGVAWQESRWNPGATSFDGGHGKGVMQIDDRYHDFARTGAVFDPARNIEYGARFLKDKYNETGSWSAALQRYNGGSDYPPLVLGHARRQPWSG